MKPQNPVIWFEIYVDDLSRAKKFYEKVFEFELTPLGNPTDETIQMLAFPADPETKNMTAGALVHFKGLKAGSNSTVVYFFSKDCGIQEGRVKEAGGEIFRPKTTIGQYGFISLVKDSEGNMIGIHSMQ